MSVTEKKYFWKTSNESWENKMKPRHRLFSLEQANALLPELELLLNTLEIKQDNFKRLEDELFFAEILERSSPPEVKLQELEAILLTLEEEIRQIRELGCFLRHAEKGLVDFPAERGEEKVYYCWKRGEREIQYFHTLRGGYWERQPI